MLHLSADRLAELGDATPSADEAAHLSTCERCERERGAYVALLVLATDARATIAPPLTSWDRIAAALPRVDVPDIAPVMSRNPRRHAWPMRAAAGFLLCAGGALLGRASAGAPLLPDRAGIAARTTTDAVTAATRLLGDSGRFATVDEAREAQVQSAVVYEQAAAFLAQHDTAGAPDSPVAYRSRLAALDRVISTTGEALREVPHDPVINQQYINTIGQREATLRQLNTALPSSLRLTSF